ncbi:MAG: transposase domain-containing protein [Bosea sp.]|nr:transposase domain-containing protein [Bosea sp. (in: a-proteobacteria)]
MRPLVLTRKNALFAGSDSGADHWVAIASLIESAKLNSVEPHAYLADIIAKIVGGHPTNRVDELLPWAFRLSPLSGAPRDVGALTTRRRALPLTIAAAAPYIPGIV